MMRMLSIDWMKRLDNLAIRGRIQAGRNTCILSYENTFNRKFRWTRGGDVETHEGTLWAQAWRSWLYALCSGSLFCARECLARLWLCIPRAGESKGERANSNTDRSTYGSNAEPVGAQEYSNKKWTTDGVPYARADVSRVFGTWCSKILGGTTADWYQSDEVWWIIITDDAKAVATTAEGRLQATEDAILGLGYELQKRNRVGMF